MPPFYQNFFSFFIFSLLCLCLSFFFTREAKFHGFKEREEAALTCFDMWNELRAVDKHASILLRCSRLGEVWHTSLPSNENPHDCTTSRLPTLLRVGPLHRLVSSQPKPPRQKTRRNVLSLFRWVHVIWYSICFIWYDI